jgi:hypothetical protein
MVSTRSLAGLGFIVVMLLALALLWWFRSAPPVIETATGEDDVLHARVAISAASDPSSTTVHEFWYITSTKQTRYVVEHYSGTPQVIQGRDGVTVTTSDAGVVPAPVGVSIPHEYSLRIGEADSDSRLDVLGRFLSYGVSLDGGGMDILETGTKNGWAALRSEFEYTDGSGEYRVSVWLEEDTLLPLEETTYDISGVSPSALGVVTLDYDTIEYVDSSGLQSGFFVAPTPAATQVTTQDVYLPEELAEEFEGFDVYWLGETFGGLPRAAIQYSSGSGRYYGGTLERFAVYYGQSWQDEIDSPAGTVQVVQIPLADYVETDEPSTPVQISNATLGTLEGLLYSSSLMLELEVGSTHVTLYARNTNELEEAAEALEALN